MSLNLRHPLFLALFASAALCGAALAAETPKPATPPPVEAARAGAAQPLTDADRALVKTATDYLQGLKMVEGKFSQTAPAGAKSSGVFYMQRPGKARFQYDAPAELLVVSDGSNVSVWDGRLKSFDQYPLWSTPLVLLLAKQVRLDKGVIVTAVEHTKDAFAITAKDARKKAEGRIVLRFVEGPTALTGWSVIDGQGRRTDVALGPLAPKASLEASLFVLRDPRPHSGRP